jgi:surface antigen
MMRWSQSLAPLAAAAAAALPLVATVFLSVDGATATEPPRVGALCPCARKQKQPENTRPIPGYFDLKATLNANDEVAALEAVQWALAEVADGATFMWHRQHGRLSGLVQPTSSFKDASDRVCRHLVMKLTSGGYSRKAEGIACRQANGAWLLEG